MSGVVVRVITRLNQGGPARQLEALVPGLANLGWTGPVLVGVAESHEPDTAAALVSAGAEVLHIPSLRRALDPALDARALDQILRHLRRIRPDIVHTHTGKAGALGRAAARIVGVPVVHTLHGHHFDRQDARGRAARAAERALGRFTTALVVLGERQRADILRHRIAPEARVHVIEPGIDLTPLVRTPGTPRKTFEIVWTGRFVPVKAPSVLVEAVAALPDDVRLTMWGVGPLREELLADVRRRGLGGRIRLPGSTDDVAGALSAADVFALSSRSEGMAISAIEAMALGVAVVVPDVGGMADLVEDGKTGILVPSGDVEALRAGILALRDDPGKRARIAVAARSEARRRFDGGRLAADTAALYAELVRHAPGASGGVPSGGG